MELHNPKDVLFTGYHLLQEYKVLKTDRGHRNGYIKLYKEHPWYGKDETEIQSLNGQDWVTVHGGITFTDDDYININTKNYNAWWVGFDCAHIEDLPDPSIMSEEYKNITYCDICPSISYYLPSIKTTDYVINECKSLIEQALGLKKNNNYE